MSKTEEMERFRSEIMQDSEAVERLKGLGDMSTFPAEVARLARERGYSFDESDVASAMNAEPADARALSEDELEAVSGGVPNTWSKTKCFTFYGHCI